VIKRTALLLLSFALSAAARANLTPSDAGVDDLTRANEDNKLQAGTFACLMLSDDQCGASSNATPFLTAPGRVAAPIFGADAAFEKLKRSYPQGEVPEILALIGRPEATYIENTCAIRVSYAMNAAGFRIDSRLQDGTAVADPKKKIIYLSDRSGVRNGQSYVIRVDELARYLLAKYGKPQVWSAKDKNTRDERPLRSAVKGKKGIILFVVNWTDATGHFDLWDGSKASHDQYFGPATDVFLWQ
jgi:hypothetical protein